MNIDTSSSHGKTIENNILKNYIKRYRNKNIPIVKNKNL